MARNEPTVSVPTRSLENVLSTLSLMLLTLDATADTVAKNVASIMLDPRATIDRAEWDQ